MNSFNSNRLTDPPSWIFNLEMYPSQSQVLAAKVMGAAEVDVRISRIPAYEPPTDIPSTLSPTHHSQRVLAAWQERKSYFESLPIERKRGSISIFSDSEKKKLIDIVDSHELSDATLRQMGNAPEVDDDVLRTRMLMEFVGFAAIPRIVAADHYLLGRSRVERLMPSLGAGLSQSVILSEEELIDAVPWRMTSPDLFALPQEALKRTSSLVLNQLAILAVRNAGMAEASTKRTEFHALILRNQEFRKHLGRLIDRNSASFLQDDERPEPLVLKPNIAKALDEQRVFMNEFADSETSQWFADIVSKRQGEVCLVDGVDLSRDETAYVVHKYLEAAARILFETAYGGRGAYPLYSEPSDKEKRNRLSNALTDDQRITDIYVQASPLLDTPERQAMESLALIRPEDATRLSFLFKLASQHGGADVYVAKSFLVSSVRGAGQHVRFGFRSQPPGSRLHFLDGKVVVPRIAKLAYNKVEIPSS